MGALSGLNILDFTTLLPGPFATMQLADMGANVISVASPSRPDIVLDQYALIPGTDVTSTRAWILRNKRNLALNLKHPEAKELIYKLVKKYDIVVEQFRPGVMDKLGLGYEKLREINPRVIFCSIKIGRAHV